MRLTRFSAYALMLATLGAPLPGRVVEPSASLAAPEIIIFHGGPLARPVAVTSWTENYALLLSSEPHEAMIPGRPSALRRPVIKLALFWGTQFGSIDGPVSDSGLAVLRRHRIPTRVD